MVYFLSFFLTIFKLHKNKYFKKSQKKEREKTKYFKIIFNKINF